MAPTQELSAFVIDCTNVGNDKVVDTAQFEKYLRDRIKVDGRTNNLGQVVKITREDHKITVEATNQFSKRYLKYLTKKYLKKNQIRDYLRVIATDKKTFELRYFNVADDGDAEEE